MRIWSPSDRRYLEAGATRWCCEWHTDPGDAVQDGELNPDMLDCNYRSFGPKGKGLAMAFAKKVDDYFGVARVYQETLVQAGCEVGFWEEDDSTVQEIEPEGQND